MVRIHLALGCNRTWKQTNSCTLFAKSIKRKKHVCCWRISFWFGQSLWKASSLYRDGGTWYPNGMSVSQARPPYPFFLGEKFDRNRKIQYIKDRTECFDDYFPCKLKNCKLKHVRNWLNLFIAYHNKELKPVKWTEPFEYIYVSTPKWIKSWYSNEVSD